MILYGQRSESSFQINNYSGDSGSFIFETFYARQGFAR